MDTKKLRQKILDLAIHGKLVPQDPNDEPASVLLERIRAEKERLIKEGKIKRSRKTAKTTDTPHYENVPFEVPKGWEWCRLGEVNDIARGGSPRPIKDYLTNSKNGVNWIKIGDTTKDGKYINSVKEKIRVEGVTKSRMVHKGDFLLTNSMSFGRPYILNVDGCIHDGWLVISPIGKVYTSDFLYYLISSSFALNQFTQVASGGVVSNLNSDKVADTIFPIAPLSEQQRIVEEIERWFKLIDVIEQGKSDLQSTIKQTKNKILDLAIHGKLVAQDPNDEPASELLKRINPKAEITCDNEHYPHLPKGWAYCTLENVCNIHDNKRKAINATERAQRTKGKDISKLFPYFGATGQAGYIDEYLIDGRYILLGEDGAPFLDIFAIKAYEVNGKCWVNNHAHILEPLCDFEYIKFVLNGVDYSDYVNGSTRLKLTQTDMRVLKIPLPPIEEQKRIVVAIAKLFNMLDAIKENL